jgi:uncharacterized membrane protein YdjX (TVP38/TMEM64 family)
MTPTASFRRILPYLALAALALAGWIGLRDHLTFDALAQNREALLAVRDAHFAATVAGFMLAYVAIVAFSLPGASLATLTGGFLFGVFPGALFNVTAATIGAVLIFAAVRLGPGEALRARIDASGGAAHRLSTASARMRCRC